MAKLNTKNTSWNLKPLAKGDNDPKLKNDQETADKETNKFVKKWQGRTDYLKDPKVLRQALDDYERLCRQYFPRSADGYYFGLRLSQDQTNPQIKAKIGKTDETLQNRINKLQFFWLSLGKISKQAVFLKDNKLAPYKHYLEKTFREAKYQLSEVEEKILILKWGPAFTNWTQLVSEILAKEEREVLIKGKKEKAGLEKLGSLINDPDKSTRDAAADAINDILSKRVEIAEAEMNAILQNKKIDDGLRGYPRPDTSRFLADDVDDQIVDVLLGAVTEQNNLARKFYALKAKVLGQNKLAYHEGNVEIGEVNKEYSYPEAVRIIHKVFSDLDPKFSEIFTSFLENGQFDVFPKKGKRGGAFCVNNLPTQPTYILLNFTNKLRDITTIAHEMGHGINAELINRKQNSLNADLPLSTTEVASTFMEDFVLQDILKSADDETRFNVYMAKLNDEVSTIFRQVAAYKFEQELHATFRQKGFLSSAEIGQMFTKHMKAYMGPAVELSPGSENWWVFWHHFRMFFYVYSYASGLLISKSLQRSVRNDPDFINKVKEFLAAGSSASPKEIFNRLGIDITAKGFWQKGLHETADLLTETEKLAKKLGKI